MSKNGKPMRPTFTTIKHRGDPKSAVTIDGHAVRKEEKVYIPEYSAFVMCVDYHGEHFVYLDPSTKKGRWFAMCTCGSPAAIVGKDVYKTETGLLICMFHAQYGRHTTGDGREWR